MITHFYELAKPVHDKHSGIAGAEWYVRIKGTESYYLMVANNEQLGQFVTFPDNEFYFPSEAAAYAAAYVYYNYYNEAYPYLVEWFASITMKTEDLIPDNGSQVMEFI